MEREPLNAQHHKALPIVERAARLAALNGAASYEVAAIVLESSGYPTDAESLRSWAKRNNVGPGAKKVPKSALERLEAAECLADRVREVLLGLPDNVGPTRAAKALGRIHSALDDYLADTAELRGLA